MWQKEITFLINEQFVRICLDIIFFQSKVVLDIFEGLIQKFIPIRIAESQLGRVDFPASANAVVQDRLGSLSERSFLRNFHQSLCLLFCNRKGDLPETFNFHTREHKTSTANTGKFSTAL